MVAAMSQDMGVLEFCACWKICCWIVIEPETELLYLAKPARICAPHAEAPMGGGVPCALMWQGPAWGSSLLAAGC